MNTTPTPHAAGGFAPLFAEPAGSPIRELFPLLSRPGMMSLAGGYPSASLLDAEGLAQAASHALGQGISALQYGAAEGLPAMRDALAQQAQARGMPASAPDVLVTTGSQQAFDLLVRVLLQPGDTALVEVPAYPATLQALRLAQANIVGVPIDADGLHTDALAELLAQMPAAQRPELLYTVPNFSNPRGSLLSAQRRQALVQLALQYGFWIVEDDPYGELHFAHAQDTASGTPATLRSMAAHLAPAGATRWSTSPACPKPWPRHCALAGCWQTRPCCAAAQWPSKPWIYAPRPWHRWWPPALAQRPLRAHGAARPRRVPAAHACLGAGLECHPDQPLRCTMPAGGMFVWADIAPHIAPQRLFEAAVQHGVLYVPGKAFYPDAAERHALRLSFAATEAQDMAEAVQRLGRAALQAQSA